LPTILPEAIMLYDLHSLPVPGRDAVSTVCEINRLLRDIVGLAVTALWG
jgi:hypothetical protein